MKSPSKRLYFSYKISANVKTDNLFLHPYFYCPIMDEGVKYLTPLHFYQCNKFYAFKEIFEDLRNTEATEDLLEKVDVYQKAKGEKGYWDIWDTKKVDVMKKANKLKFDTYKVYMIKLIETGKKDLVYEEPNQNVFWGGTTLGSQNMLGKILMELRSEYAATLSDMFKSTEIENQSPLDFNLSLLNINKSESIQIFEDLQKERTIRNKKLTDIPNTDTEINCIEIPKTMRQSVLINKLLGRVSPLFHLSQNDRALLINESKILQYDKDAIIISPNKKKPKRIYLLLEGNVYIHDDHKSNIERLKEGAIFDMQSIICHKITTYVRAEGVCQILMISMDWIEKFIKEKILFSNALSRSIYSKSDAIANINKFIDFVRKMEIETEVDMKKCVQLFKNMEPSMYPGCNAEVCDFSSWSYAISRLPNDITEILTFLLTNTIPEELCFPDFLDTMKIMTQERKRASFKMIQGKCMVVLRDLRTDLVDFMSNICIHMIESKKLIKRVAEPLVLSQLYKKDLSPQDLEKILTSIGFNESEINSLHKLFQNKLQQSLLNLCFHHNDFKIQLMISGNKANSDPIEIWIQKVWSTICSALQLEEGITCDDIPDDQLIVDIIQGTKRAFLGLVSPYKYVNREHIEKFAAASKIVLKSKFELEEDKFIAICGYYFMTHPEKLAKASEYDALNGIICMDEFDITGINLQIVEVNKLQPEYIDKKIKVTKSESRHIILHIGYTFGEQTSNVIKGLADLFGKKIRSFNVIGKAGGFVGDRCDILVANKIIHYEKGDIFVNKDESFKKESLIDVSHKNVFVGPLLTVAGTIVQNKPLLNYYSKFRNCIGVEMEGFYFLKEIEKFKSFGILNPNINCSFLYYISDLPLNPDKLLSKEHELYNRDEGVPVINSMYRYLLNNLFSPAPKLSPIICKAVISNTSI